MDTLLPISQCSHRNLEEPGKSLLSNVPQLLTNMAWIGDTTHALELGSGHWLRIGIVQRRAHDLVRAHRLHELPISCLLISVLLPFATRNLNVYYSRFVVCDI